MFEFTRTEFEEISKECMLNDEYKRLFEMKIMGYSRIKMADELGMSVDNLDKMIRKLKKKIKKVI